MAQEKGGGFFVLILVNYSFFRFIFSSLLGPCTPGLFGFA